jgi:multidrug efflux pump subunit AcrA (membrane-fusion protein)
MEQVKLAGVEPAPLPEPLTEEELAQQEAEVAEERAEIAAVRERSNQNIEEEQRSIMDQLEAARYQAEQARLEAAAAREEAEAARQEADAARQEAGAARREADEARAAAGGQREDSDDGSDSRGTGANEHKMHNLHTPGEAKSGASAEPVGVYVAKAPTEKICGGCMHTSQAPMLEEPARQSEIARTTGKAPGEPPRDSP